MIRRPKATSTQRCTKRYSAVGGGLPTVIGGNDDGRGHSSKFRNGAPKWTTKFLRIAMIKQNTSALNVAIFLLAAAASITIFLLQLHAFIREYQGPLDHVTTSLLEPYYSIFCPDFSAEDDLNINPTKHESTNNIMSWNCNGVLNFPRIFMIGARDDDEDTFHSWAQLLRSPNNETTLSIGSESQYDHRQLPHLERISTLKMSNQYALSGGALRSSSTGNSGNKKQQFLCRKMKWEHRLFAVYQTVFSNLLTNYPNDTGFVIVEDDAVLKNPNAFVHEVCNAHHHELDFYSLYQSPIQRNKGSCIYLHGTVAFYIRRTIMKKIVGERRRGSFCRFPIDMYVSKMGPWYSTRREIVGHSELGRIGSITRGSG